MNTEQQIYSGPNDLSSRGTPSLLLRKQNPVQFYGLHA